ncbi:Flp pilus assembly protein CpaB [Novosphingobium sp. AP12]|uniref:Flp pilus assembly protein CpaB n=1 Tax=Novosphingobium sp. AP12 TaxID=1144305 RepID=UPI00027224B2|nr:Flp pilus assembly protein CpaB [Novosphingobium sp. AP12]EJL20482.1 Flp pilus assembly protein CpaB [Novosphingobium sp. AP12]
MRLGSKAKLTIAIGVVAAATFSFLGVRELSRSSASRATPVVTAADRPTTTSGIVFATTTRDVKIGETIRADMIRNAAFDPARVPIAATPAEAIGRVATRDIAANTLIPRGALEQESKLAIRVPVGMRAISIDTTAEIAVAGLVRPGDRVDVQVVYPGEDAIGGARGNGRSRARALLQMVPVLAVGDVVLGTQAQGGVADSVSSPPPPARTVTLALTPQQVSELSLAKSTGALYLSLRNPEDSVEVSSVQIASSPEPAPRALVAPSAPAIGLASQAPPRPAAPARPKPHAIELVVGGNREVIYSGSGSR